MAKHCTLTLNTNGWKTRYGRLLDKERTVSFVHCLQLRLPKGKSHGGGFLGKLVTMPFQNFKKAKGKDGILDTHANYQFHKDAVLHGKEFVLQYDDPDRRIDGIIDKQLQESASFNKLALRSIVECVIFCGKQGISFRGHRDDATASDPTNRGNFISLLRFRAQSDDVLRRFRPLQTGL